MTQASLNSEWHKKHKKRAQQHTAVTEGGAIVRTHRKNKKVMFLMGHLKPRLRTRLLPTFCLHCGHRTSNVPSLHFFTCGSGMCQVVKVHGTNLRLQTVRPCDHCQVAFVFFFCDSVTVVRAESTHKGATGRRKTNYPSVGVKARNRWQATVRKTVDIFRLKSRKGQVRLSTNSQKQKKRETRNSEKRAFLAVSKARPSYRMIRPTLPTRRPPPVSPRTYARRMAHG